MKSKKSEEVPAIREMTEEEVENPISNGIFLLQSNRNLFQNAF